MMSTNPAAVFTPVFHTLAPKTRRWVSIIFWVNLACQIGIIVTGGVVRLTKSGLGCSTWPHCEPGQFTPEYHPSSGLRPFIEFGNRMLTFVLLVFAILLVIATYRHLKVKGKGFIRLAWAPLAITIFQAIWGILVVKLHLAPFFVSVHFLVSPIAVVVSSVLLYRLYEGDGTLRAAAHRGARLVYWPLALVAAAVIVLGTIVTGSGPYSGDEHTASRFPFNPAEIAWLHADVVWLLCGLIFGMIVTLLITKAHRKARTALWGLVIVTALQAVIGYTQYFTNLPEFLVGMHMLGAALFAGAVAWLGASLHTWFPLGAGPAPEDHKAA